MPWGHLNCLVAAEEYELLRDFMARSLTGAVLTDEMVRDAAQGWFNLFGWQDEDGLHRHSRFESFLLGLQVTSHHLPRAPIISHELPWSPTSSHGLPRAPMVFHHLA